jgi:hypothetical protein
LTALIVAGLSAFVVITDGFGLGILLSTLLAVALERSRVIGPCPRLLYVLSALLALRAAWLLATTRRPLVAAVWRLVRRKTSQAVSRLTPVSLHHHRHRHPHVPCPHSPRGRRACATPTVDQVGHRPE